MMTSPLPVTGSVTVQGTTGDQYNPWAEQYLNELMAQYFSAALPSMGDSYGAAAPSAEEKPGMFESGLGKANIPFITPLTGLLLGTKGVGALEGVQGKIGEAMDKTFGTTSGSDSFLNNLAREGIVGSIGNLFGDELEEFTPTAQRMGMVPEYTLPGTSTTYDMLPVTDGIDVTGRRIGSEFIPTDFGSLLRQYDLQGQPFVTPNVPGVSSGDGLEEVAVTGTRPQDRGDQFTITTPPITAPAATYNLQQPSAPTYVSPAIPAVTDGAMSTTGGGGASTIGSGAPSAPGWIDWDRLRREAQAANTTLANYVATNWNQIRSPVVEAANPRPLEPVKKACGGLMMARGGGSGRDDNIPAMLSPYEYVIDAETTALLGDGSPDEGARRLDAMREEIRRHKGQALAKGRFTPPAQSPLNYIKGVSR